MTVNPQQLEDERRLERFNNYKYPAPSNGYRFTQEAQQDEMDRLGSSDIREGLARAIRSAKKPQVDVEDTLEKHNATRAERVESRRIATAEKLGTEEQEKAVREALDKKNQQINAFIAGYTGDKNSPEFYDQLNKLQAEARELHEGKMGGGYSNLQKIKNHLTNASDKLYDQNNKQIGDDPSAFVQSTAGTAARGLMGGGKDPSGLASATRDMTEQLGKSAAEQAAIGQQQLGKAAKDYKTNADENAIAQSAFKAQQTKQQLGVGAGAGAAALAGVQAAAGFAPNYEGQQQRSDQLMQQGAQQLETGRAMQRAVPTELGSASALDYQAGQEQQANIEKENLATKKAQDWDDLQQIPGFQEWLDKLNEQRRLGVQ